MKHEIEIYELIEKYLQGNLKGDELKSIEERIQSDPEFALEVSKHQESHNFIFERAMVDMKDQIGKIHQKNTISGNGKLGWRNLFSYLGVLLFTAALIIVVSAKNRYEEGTLFQGLRKKTVAENSDSIRVAVKPIKQKKQVYVQQEIVTDTLSLSDSLNTIDTSDVYSQKDIEEELSDIINSAVPVVNSESQPELKNNDPESKNNPQESSTSKTDCNDIEIEADIESENSCDDKPTGKISVNKQSLDGGEPPYQLSIDGGKNYYSNLAVSNLSPSKYKVFIKDANNCFSKLGDILIKAIDCSYEYVFSPDKGKVWKIPTKESAGEIKIFNKQGKLVYSAEFDMPGDYEWDGRTNSGGELPMGAYLFVLKLRDNETLKGNVTIVR